MSVCPLCQEEVDEALYEQHVERCLTGLIDNAELELAQMASSSTSTEPSATPLEDQDADIEKAAPSQVVSVWLQGRLGDLQTALQSSGFQIYGAISCHPTSNVTIELKKLQAPGRRGWTASIVVDRVLEDDLADWCRVSVPEDTAINGPGGPALTSWLPALLTWVKSQREVDAPGFLDDDDQGTAQAEDEADWDPAFQYLPTASELGVTAGRSLQILTWGRALMKTAPHSSQHTFNAAVLNGRGGGVDLKKFNGLSEGVQHNVARCSLFPEWLRLVCAAIEKNNYTCISVVCTKGRHRSVAAAEILQRLYYPAATISHLTIK